MKFYGPKEVCQELGIGDSTLRKWVGHLRRIADYEFVMDQYGHRSYSDRDIAVLRKMQSYLAQKHTYEDAVKKVCLAKNAKHDENAQNIDIGHVLSRTGVPGRTHFLDEEMYEKMLSLLEKQTVLNVKLVERIERLEEREAERDRRLEDRDRKLTEVLRNLLDSKNESAPAFEGKPKKRWFDFLR